MKCTLTLMLLCGTVLGLCCAAQGESDTTAAQLAALAAAPASFQFTMVADLDLASRNGASWRSFLKRGRLQQNEHGNFTVSWEAPIPISTEFGRNDRGMELSELVNFNGELLTMC